MPEVTMFHRWDAETIRSAQDPILTEMAQDAADLAELHYSQLNSIMEAHPEVFDTALLNK
jgi:hypothetical protein